MAAGDKITVDGPKQELLALDMKVLYRDGFYRTYSLVFVCANTLLIRTECSSPRGLEVFKYSRNEGRWSKVAEVELSDDTDEYFGINHTRNQIYSGPEIHYAIVVGKEARSGLHERIYICTYDMSDDYEAKIKGKYIYGKAASSTYGAKLVAKIAAADDYPNYKGITANDLNTLCPNPFMTDWGDITSSRGEAILADEEYRLVAYDFDSPDN